MKFVDLLGKVYGKLTVVKQISAGKHSKWLCKCECGKYKEIRKDHLISGASKSCGCNHYKSDLKSEDEPFIENIIEIF